MLKQEIIDQKRFEITKNFNRINKSTKFVIFV